MGVGDVEKRCEGEQLNKLCGSAQARPPRVGAKHNRHQLCT